MISPETPTVIVTTGMSPEDGKEEVVFLWNEDSDTEMMRASWRSVTGNYVTRVVPTSTPGEHSVYLIDTKRLDKNAGIVASASGQSHEDAWLLAAGWALGGKDTLYAYLVKIEPSRK